MFVHLIDQSSKTLGETDYNQYKQAPAVERRKPLNSKAFEVDQNEDEDKGDWDRGSGDKRIVKRPCLSDL